MKRTISYLGITFTVLIALFLFLAVGSDLSTFDVVYSDGSDDARWLTLGTLSKNDLYNLTIWGVYLLVTAFHVIIYFEKLLESEKNLNWWTLPTFDMGHANVWCIILSSVFSVLFLRMVFWFDFTMPEVFMPHVTYLDMKELTGGYPGIDSFWAFVYKGDWIVFTFFTTLHLLIYVKKKHYGSRQKNLKSQ